MTDTPKKGRGGSRKHPDDCKCGNCPVMGRKKQERPTNANVALRVLQEAKALLKHTDWNISEVAYGLGFEEPAHFNNFFKKHTRLRPTEFRV